MIIREFNKLEEIQKYYDERTDAYIFKEDGKWIDLVIFAFNLKVEANINARDIKAYNIDVWNINALNIEAFEINASYIQSEDINAFNITAYNINAGDINANNIKAGDISYWGVCFAYKNIICNSIKGRKENARHFVLDGEIKVLENGEQRERLEMNSYQKLKSKCDYLENQVKLFKDALTINHTPSKLIENEDGSMTYESKIYIQQNELIDEQIKLELQRWVAKNLDEESIMHLLELKKEIESE